MCACGIDASGRSHDADDVRGDASDVRRDTWNGAVESPDGRDTSDICRDASGCGWDASIVNDDARRTTRRDVGSGSASGSGDTAGSSSGCATAIGSAAAAADSTDSTDSRDFVEPSAAWSGAATVHAWNGSRCVHDAAGDGSWNASAADNDDAEFTGDSGNDCARHVESSGDPESIVSDPGWVPIVSSISDRWVRRLWPSEPPIPESQEEARERQADDEPVTSRLRDRSEWATVRWPCWPGERRVVGPRRRSY
jgi:hypothetical protein